MAEATPSMHSAVKPTNELVCLILSRINSFKFIIRMIVIQNYEFSFLAVYLNFLTEIKSI